MQYPVHEGPRPLVQEGHKLTVDPLKAARVPLWVCVAVAGLRYIGHDDHSRLCGPQGSEDAPQVLGYIRVEQQPRAENDGLVEAQRHAARVFYTDHPDDTK